MTSAQFRRKLVEAIRRALEEGLPLSACRVAAAEGLDLCRFSSKSLPKVALDAFRRAHPGLWKTVTRK
jgi:hypothetical protein